MLNCFFYCLTSQNYKLEARKNFCGIFPSNKCSHNRKKLDPGSHFCSKKNYTYLEFQIVYFECFYSWWEINAIGNLNFKIFQDLEYFVFDFINGLVWAEPIQRTWKHTQSVRKNNKCDQIFHDFLKTFHSTFFIEQTELSETKYRARLLFKILNTFGDNLLWYVSCYLSSFIKTGVN